MKALLLFVFLVTLKTSFAQKEYVSPNGNYKFSAPESFVLQQTANQGNEFIFINNELKTSLLIKVNSTTMTEESIKKFKLAADSVIERNVFSSVSNPKIIKRGEVDHYKDQSIYFHVTHDAQMQGENKYLINYIFYSNGKEINLIFRTDKENLDKASPLIAGVVNSFALL